MRKLVLLTLLIFTSCSRIMVKRSVPRPPERRVRTVSPPIFVRIKLHTFEKELPLVLNGSYSVGEVTLKPGHYIVKISRRKKSRFVYYQTLFKTSNYDSAYLYFQNHHDPDVYFIDVGTIFKIGNTTLDNREFYVLKGPFKSKKDLEHPYAEPANLPHGVVEILNEKGHRVISANDSLTLKPQGGIISFAGYKNLSGEVTVTFDTGARGIVVLKSELEDYIKHVLPSEMPVGFPEEALKAQAVVARTFTLANLGKFYRYQPFDFTSTPLSQTFGGKRFEVSDTIVEETRGIVLFYNHRIADVFYHSTCGGHTEDITYIWNTGSIPYLRGVKDGNFDYDLQDPIGVRMFVESPPESIFCRMTDNPVIMHYVKKNFRWEVKLRRKQVEEWVKKFTGKGIGKLISLTPVKRGVSGRVTEIVFTGTKKSVDVRGEYRIRRILGGLKSSLFIVNYVRDEKGDIVNVVIKGGGAGHGVGMCQVGAGILAEHGFKMKDIISHYFPGVKGVKIY